MNLQFSHFNLLTNFAVKVVTIHILLYRGYVEYDKNNDIKSPKVNTAVPWRHSGTVENNLEPFNMLVLFV